ncbi:hypothetical protein [Candidatus Regiella insecticola]|uniref:hypothetical protein n=1 Tax=Candidatus Regiella insecticola TaxID=138073 RepID=UPI0002F11E6B|nr:hypothetical protein [Candidatus Regiella insecticola]
MLAAKGEFTLTADKLHNDNGGQIIGEQAMSFHTANLDNQQGKIEALGNLLLDNVQAYDEIK